MIPRPRWRSLPLEPRGSALVLALMVLSGLTVLAVALLSVGALEPQISRNHADMLRARYLAEAGIEQALDILAAHADSWTTYLNGSSCSAGAVLVDSPLPGHDPSDGQVHASVRNDCGAGDEGITGVTREIGFEDTNGKLVVVSVGTFRDVTHTIVAGVSNDGISGSSSHSVPLARVRTYNWSDH